MIIISRKDAVRWLLAVIVASCGCDSAPQAPELVDSPVYQNDSEGFRFRVPEGWTQTANANLPPGNFEGENFLVRYLVQSPAGGSTLQVLCVIDKDQKDLAEHHLKPSFGVANWKLTSGPDAVDHSVGEAIRMTCAGRFQSSKMHKEVLCIRRDNRVYSFVGLYFDGDDKAQHAIRRALDSLQWDA